MSTIYYWLLLCASKSNKQLWNNKIKQILIYLFWSLLYCPFGHQQKENERFLNREGSSESSKAVIKGRPPKIWFTIPIFSIKHQPLRYHTAPREPLKHMQSPHRRASWLSWDSNRRPSCCEAIALFSCLSLWRATSLIRVSPNFTSI